MKKKAGILNKIKFYFENTFSGGIKSMILWLGIIVLICSLLTTFIVYLFQMYPGATSFIDLYWYNLTGGMDAAFLPEESGWDLRSISIIITLFGVFIFGILVSLLTVQFESKVESLRKGRSLVPIENHTLFLGWSDKITFLINQLITANPTKKKIYVVILADKDKVEMEDAIREKIVNRKAVNIICRSGVPFDVDDLEIVNPDGAKSIIILSPDDEHADLFTVKTVMALTKNPKRKPESYHIIAQIKKPYNLEAAQVIGGNEVIYLQSADFVSKLISLSCRQPGLSNVMMDLFSFEGQDIYFKNCEELAGKTYKDAVLAFDDHSVFGLQKKGEKIVLNPDKKTAISLDDQLIVIAENNLPIQSPKYDPPLYLVSVVNIKTTSKDDERILILGWNDKCPQIIKGLNDFASSNSYVLIVANNDEMESTLEEISENYKNLKVTHLNGDPSIPSVLGQIDLEKYDDAIIIGDNTLETQLADAKTMLTLIQLRYLSDKSNKNLNIISEIFDMKNRKIVKVAHSDDFIISDDIISMVIAQFSENPGLSKIFEEFLSITGNEIYLHPALDYIKENCEVNFYTVIHSALEKGQTAIGYRIHAFSEIEEKAYGIVLNPHKSDPITFTEKDRIIIISEN